MEFFRFYDVFSTVAYYLTFSMYGGDDLMQGVPM